MPMPSAKNPNRPPKADQVETAYAGIRNLMFYNEIVPGQKLSYRQLAERLGMSQTPIIQALKRLEFQNLVYREPHRGYYTAPICIREVEEIYDLRELIELDLLTRSIKIFDEKSLKRLKNALDAHRQASRKPYLQDRLVRDVDFHLTLADLSGQQVHQQTLKNLFDLLYLKYGSNILFSTSLDQADLDHQSLYEKMIEKDHKGARQVLSRHIQRVKKHVIKGLKKREQSKTRLAL